LNLRHVGVEHNVVDRDGFLRGRLLFGFRDVDFVVAGGIRLGECVDRTLLFDSKTISPACSE